MSGILCYSEYSDNLNVHDVRHMDNVDDELGADLLQSTGEHSSDHQDSCKIGERCTLVSWSSFWLCTCCLAVHAADYLGDDI
eukprot:SAG31_NODE_33643_length_341_cov_1.070248_1_plen_81_part_10